MRMAIKEKNNPKPTKEKKEIGLQHKSTNDRDERRPGLTHLRQKCGSNCSPGIKRKAGNVMRLKMPATAMKDSTILEKNDECFYNQPLAASLSNQHRSPNKPCSPRSVELEPDPTLRTESRGSWWMYASGKSRWHRTKQPARLSFCGDAAKKRVHESPNPPIQNSEETWPRATHNKLELAEDCPLPFRCRTISIVSSARRRQAISERCCGWDAKRWIPTLTWTGMRICDLMDWNSNQSAKKILWKVRL